MSDYEHDDRVTLLPGRAAVTGGLRVVDMPGLGWCTYSGPHMALVGAGYPSRDAAIRSLIGEPAVTS